MTKDRELGKEIIPDGYEIGEILHGDLYLCSECKSSTLSAPEETVKLIRDLTEFMDVGEKDSEKTAEIKVQLIKEGYDWLDKYEKNTESVSISGEDECSFCHHPRILHDKFGCKQLVAPKNRCLCGSFQSEDAPIKKKEEKY